MAFVRKKIKKGNPYYYIVESYRDGGHVKQRILEYIGPPDNLMALALKGWQAQNDSNEPTVPAVPSSFSFRSYLHGSCMAMYYMAQKIGIEKILDQHLPPKTVKGQSRSRVLLFAMIHRAVDPGSKNSFPSWAKETSLPYYLKFDADDFNSASFWEAMDGISEDNIVLIQRAIVDRVMEMTGITPTTFHLDYTNYFTFIDSKNNRCVMCRRGHNKQKRDDLRQFSLAMLTSYALQVPFIFELYDGNKNDKSEFASFTDFIRKELKAHQVDPSEVTIVFDGGSNSEENFKDLGFHFICAHTMTSCKELYDISLDQYKEIHTEGGQKRLAYRIDHMRFSGIEGAGILTYSKALEDGQMTELKKDIGKAEELCAEINEKLARPNTRIYTELKRRKERIETEIRKAEEHNAALKKEQQEKKTRGRQKKEKAVPVWDEESELKAILEGMLYKGRKYIREFSSVSVYKNHDGSWNARFGVDNEAKDAYCKKYYGKKLTCTDRTDWTSEQILTAYCEQECIENNIFKVSKDTDHFSVRPQYHWTDDKIRVHTFICLCAMTIAEMLRIEFENSGMNLTKAAMLDQLSTIRDGWVFENEKKVTRTLEKMDNGQEKLWSVVERLKNELAEN